VNSHAAEGSRILICAPYGQDAPSIANLLGANGFDAVICVGLDEIAAQLDARLGAVLLTEEALRVPLEALETALNAQPPWSNTAFIMLAMPQSGRAAPPDAPRLGLSRIASNMIVLERPLGSASLISAVQSAIRGRQKQLELRDRIQELADSRQAVEERAAELRLVADSLPMVIGFIDRDYRYRFANKGYADWFDWRPADMIGRTVAEVAGMQRHLERKPLMDLALAGEPVQFEVPWPHNDGRRRDAEIRYIPRRDANGQVEGFYAFVMDVTDRRRTAEALEAMVAERTRALQEEVANRAETEAALRQSQKMEAVGQLTGGIAHDFNNMMTGVIGSLDLMKRRIASGRLDDLDRFMDAASASAERAAALTQRLLAFSRRQSLDSKPLDVNALIGSLEGLLSRSLNERIELRTQLADGLPLGLADENQLESAILNLVLNARDAMPAGGMLTIGTGVETVETSNADVSPGRYVVVAVTDAGVGIEPEVLDKVFEPFFTTKPLGQGTGLGLSMVYGFAKQNGGVARVESEPGRGTTVRILLPAAEGAVVEKAPPKSVHAPVGDGQTVLVVEDDDSVRMLVAEVLDELGYVAILAPEPLGAIPILSGDQRIDLLISDVGLPGITGRELAEVARRRRPDLPILFITGYAENAAIRADFLNRNMELITKPFSLEQLAVKVRGMMTE
jgi:PAS domain S-box-containing protein